MLKVIVDFDGTLTAEETQAGPLAEKSLDTLAGEFLGVPRLRLAEEYEATRARLLDAPSGYWWEVNGCITSYCDEGAFILNTTTLQVMLRENPAYRRAVAAAFPHGEYEAVVTCTNYLFHRHTAELPPAFRPAAHDVLAHLAHCDWCRPVILTNSLGDKVQRQLSCLDLDAPLDVLGDTRQYHMDPSWKGRSPGLDLSQSHLWTVSGRRHVDLRRPVYYEALRRAAADGSPLAVVGDTLSLPGALPLRMGIPFFLLRTPYTPAWSVDAVKAHPSGHVLGDLADLPAALETAAGSL